MTGLLRRIIGFLRSQEASSTVEFVLTVPVLMTIFMASVESGMMMVRSVMMDQAVDHVMRDLRLNNLGAVNHASLRNEICDRLTMIDNCRSAVKIELTPISTQTWAVPTAPATCINRAQPMEPYADFSVGGANEPMLVRVCVTVDPIFPMTGMGLRMRSDGQGGYTIVAMSVFANEPR
jgi:Flp pilus assembly protein TadG